MIKMFELSLTLTFGLVFAGLFGSSAQAIATIANSAIIIEVATGETLMAPASMSKLMTLYMLFERLKDGSLSLDDTFRVSDNAWRKGGAKSGSSTMFLSPRKRVKVEDLIRGIIVQSGNDACIVVAEGLSGSEAGFAVEMTERAREIGLASSTFRNATGWPDPEHRMTPRDLATLGQRLIEKFPEYYRFFKETEFRTLFMLSVCVSLICAPFTFMFVLRKNVEYGIPDLELIIFSDIVMDTLNQCLVMLPLTVLFAKITPVHIEATAFAFLTGTFNLCGNISGLMGTGMN